MPKLMPSGRGKAAETLSAAPDTYRDLIVKSVMREDNEMLDTLVAIMKQAESAKQILRAKGYGTNGMSIEAMARLVPSERVG